MAIKTISQFEAAVPTDNDYILFEQNGEGKHTTIGDAVNTCSLSYGEIMASTDLTNKVASASALKETMEAFLLWTNANPTANFGSQEISLDLNPYKGIYLEILPNSSFPYPGGFVLLKTSPDVVLSGTGTGSNSLWDNSSSIMYSRIVSIFSNKIAFSNGFYSQASSTYTRNNAYAIPYRIYGIK